MPDDVTTHFVRKKIEDLEEAEQVKMLGLKGSHVYIAREPFDPEAWPHVAKFFIHAAPDLYLTLSPKPVADIMKREGFW